MAQEIIISSEGLSKKYLIGHQAERQRYLALRDVIAQRVRSAVDMARGRGLRDSQKTEEFWALKDVSFEVRRGEVLGIIGRNGAGKSTLLKILSRITEPTEGRVRIKGRVASLLEVGTGFHQELTGRENIYLNGAILGMSRAEIKRKFDEIVAFAEVEKFLDTPVKRYSSGMYVRLAFAVAAHLEPEILVVDEVLAVGDAEFQKKCLGKMSEVASGGKTILFVSHNMNAVERLCERVVVLERGSKIGDFVDVREGIARYLASGSEESNATIWKNVDSSIDNAYFVPFEFSVTSSQRECMKGEPFSNEYDIGVNVTGTIKQSDPALNIGFALYSEDGTLLFWSVSTDQKQDAWPSLSTGPISLTSTIPRRMLNEGRYYIHLLSSLHHRAWILEPQKNAPVISFCIQGGLSDSPFWDHKRPGLFGPVLTWEVSRS